MNNTIKPDKIARLLDMLAGWEHFTATSMKSCRDPDCEDAIADLYQDAGTKFMSSDEDPSDDEVKQFIVDKIIPLIIKGT